MDENMILYNLCYETMIKYNGEFFFQDRYSKKEEAISFNDAIFAQIINDKTIEEIKEIYDSQEEVEETI